LLVIRLVRKVLLSFLLAAAAAALAAPAWAQSEPVVEPIPAPARADAATGALAAPAPQTEDEETPSAHHATQAFNRTAPSTGEPSGSQLAVGLLLGVVSVYAAIRLGGSTTGDRQWWYGGAALAGGAVATGAVVCAIGQASPTRHGGCRASMAGALIGALAVVPGLLLAVHQASQPCTAGPNAPDDACANAALGDGILDLLIGGGGYVLGTAHGARLGWQLGATPRSAAPGPALNVSLLSAQF
jgi:hypothetical protein